MDNIKTRNLSIGEYFLQLQKEYLLAEFRRKVYFNPKDKAYYQRVMSLKKEKIESISKRNRLNSIYNSEEYLNDLNHELFTVNGKPKFVLNEKDRENYYSLGNEFSYRGKVYVLDQIREDGSFVLYSEANQIYESAREEEICRIL